MNRARRNWLGAAAVVACALASIATSPPRVSYPRAYPAWRITAGAEKKLGKVVYATLWVSKSGKTGVGLTLRLESCADKPRTLVLRKVELSVDRHPGRIRAKLSPAQSQIVVKPHTTAHHYIALPFDNQRLWNRGRSSGQLTLWLELDGRPHTWVLDTRHQRGGPHRAVYRYGPAVDPCPGAAKPRCPQPARDDTVLEPVPASKPAPETGGPR